MELAQTHTPAIQNRHPALDAAQHWSLEERRMFAKLHPKSWERLKLQLDAYPVPAPKPERVTQSQRALTAANEKLHLELAARDELLREAEDRIEVLEDMMRIKGKPIYQPCPMGLYVRAFCAAGLVSRGELNSQQRSRRISRTRQALMWFAKTYTDLNLREIGVYMGGRDHSTVIHAYKSVEGNPGAYAHIIHDAVNWMSERAELPDGVHHNKVLDVAMG